MIFYNAGRFIGAAVQSVLDQTYPNVELVLVDDGSCDDSSTTARGYAERDPERVRLLQHPGHVNRGTGASRNLGMHHARGELVAFLDADDVWVPSHLSHEVSVLLAHPEAAMVCGQALRWYTWNGSDGPDVHQPLAFPGGTVVPPPNMLTASFRVGYPTPVCCLLVRRAALQSVGAIEEQFTSMSEDVVLLAKLYLRFTAVIGGTTTAYYRQHDASACVQAKQSGKYHPRCPNPYHRAYLEWLLMRPELNASDTDPALLLAVNKALAPYRRPWAGDKFLKLRGTAHDAIRAVAPISVRRAVRRLRGYIDRLGSDTRHDAPAADSAVYSARRA
jgi:glycosyltransferase involved in cell wall biosynthesis